MASPATSLSPDLAVRAAEALARLDRLTPAALLAQARSLREAGHGRRITFSRKVFIPLTTLCRDYLRLLHVPRRTR